MADEPEKDPGDLTLKVEDADANNDANNDANGDEHEYKPDKDYEDCLSDADFNPSDEEDLDQTTKSANAERRRLKRKAYKRAYLEKRKLKRKRGELQGQIGIYSQGGVSGNRRKVLIDAKESGLLAQILEKASKDILLTEEESKLLEDDRKVREHNTAKEALCKEATESGLYSRLKEKKSKNEELTEDEERTLALCRMFDRKKVLNAKKEGKLKLISWKKYKDHELDEEEREILALCEEFNVKLPTNHFKVSIN